MELETVMLKETSQKEKINTRLSHIYVGDKGVMQTNSKNSMKAILEL